MARKTCTVLGNRRGLSEVVEGRDGVSLEIRVSKQSSQRSGQRVEGGQFSWGRALRVKEISIDQWLHPATRGPIQEGHSPNNLLALRGELGGLAGDPQMAGHNPSFQLLAGPHKARGIRCFDFVFAEGRSQVLGGIPAGLLCFRAGLLDVNACVLEFLSHPFCLVSEGFHLLRQPGNLFMEHIEICWGRRRGLHIHVAELTSQVAGRFIHCRFTGGLFRSLFWLVSVQSTTAGAFVSLQTVTESQARAAATQESRGIELLQAKEYLHAV